MRWLTILVLSLFAAPLMAQDANAPSPTAEPFSVLPNRVVAGAEGVELRLVAGSKDLFASSSVKIPTIAFGSGVTAVAGSFAVLNATEASVSVNVEDDALGGVEVRLSFYSKDGTKIIRQERATIGVVGNNAVGATTITVGAERVNLVTVNVTTEQTLGAVFLKGRVSGALQFLPPTGMTFAANQTPVVTVESGNATVANVTVLNGRESFAFSVTNTTSSEVSIRIDNLIVSTNGFGTKGGKTGNLVSTVKGTPFGTDEGLVVNAYTGLSTLTGDAIIADTPVDNGSGTGTPTTGTPGTDGEGTGTPTTPGTGTSTGGRNTSVRNGSSSSSPSSTGDSTPNNSGRTDMPNGGWGQLGESSGVGGSAGGVPGGRPNGNNGFVDNGNGSVGDAGGSDVGGAPVTGSAASGGKAASDSMGMEMRKGKLPTADEKPTGPVAQDGRTSSETPLLRSNRLYFADEEFKRMDALVLDQKLRSGKGAVVWIVLERGEDLSDEVDTLKVSIRLGTQLQEVTLTETGAKTGVFRSDKRGIAVTASGN